MQKVFITIDFFLIALISYGSVNLFYKYTIGNLGQTMASAVHRQAETENAVPEDIKTIYHPISFYQNIIQRNLFNTFPPKKDDPKTSEIQEIAHTELKLHLWGTIAGRENHSYAVIEDVEAGARGKRQKLYQVGDKVQNAQIVQILRDQIVLSVNGEKELLKLEKYNTGSSRYHSSRSRYTRNAGGRNNASMPVIRRTIKRSKIDRATSDLGKLMQQVRFRPHPEGVKLSRVRRGIFRQLGLRTGDIITEIDGRSLQSVDNAMEFYEALKNASKLNIRVKRRNRYRSYQYTIK